MSAAPTRRVAGAHPPPATDTPAGVSGHVLRALPAVTLAAVLTLTATAEFELARTVLNLPPHIAWALPVAVDSYVLAALRSGRDVPAALAVMAGALGASTTAHLVTARHPDGALPPTVVAPAATAIMIVLVVVAWRVHVLIGHTPPTRSTADREPVPVTVGAVPPTQGSVPARVPPTEVHGETVPALGPTAPAPEPNAPAPGSVPSDHSWGVPRPDGRAQGGPEPTAVPTAVPGPPEPDPEVRKGLSDREIEAAIDGCSPGIRALRRRYGIGHSRAARIHQQITEVAPSTSAPRQSAPTIQTTDSTPTDPEESPKPFTSNRIPESKPESPVNPSSKPLEESQDHAEPESHPCITDRVGPATPAGESDPAAETAVGAIWNGAGGR